MPICDLCNESIDSGSPRYSPFLIQTAVQLGVRPPKRIFNLGAVFGMSQQELEQGWVRQVMADTTEWMLCPGCAWKVRSRFIAVTVIGLALVGGAVALVLYWMNS